MEKEIILSVNNFYVDFYIYVGEVKVICDVNFELKKGEIFVIVGEFGLGKFVIIRILIGLNVKNLEILGNV